MASMGVTVDFNANLTRFTSSLDKATNDLSKFQTNASRIGSTIGKTFAGLGIAAIAVAGAQAFTGLITGSINALDNLNDLNKKTGISVELLSGLGLAAQQSGSDLDSIASSINKLSKNIGENGDKFVKLGISTKDPLEAFKQFADIFAAIEDPQARAAFGAEALGKSWEGAAPLLAEGGKAIGEMVEKGRKLSSATQEAASQADEFNDAMAELKGTVGGFGVNLAVGVIGPLNTAIARMQEAYKEAGLLGVVFSNLKAAGNVVADAGAAVFTDKFADNETKLKNVNKELKSLISIQKDMKGAGTVSQFIYGDNAERDKEIKGLEARRAAIEKAMKPIAAPAINTGKTAADQKAEANDKEKANLAASKMACEFGGGVWNGKSCSKPQAKSGGGAKAAKDDPSKKLLENSINDLERLTDQEGDILASRNRFLDLFNNENLLSTRDYFAGKRAAQEENTAATIALIDKEIAQRRAAMQAGSKTDNAEQQDKINAAVERKAKLQRQVSEDSIQLGLEEQRAYADLGKEIRGVSADLLELQGKKLEAAQLRIDDQFKPLLERFTAQGDEGSVRLVESLKAAQLAQEAFNDAADRSGLIQEELRNIEERLSITKTTGAITELDYLKQISDARANAASRLKAEADSQASIATLSGSKPLQLQAEAAKNAVDELISQSELVGKKFDTVFKGSFGDAFGSFVKGTKTAKEAFSDFAGSVLSQIADIAAQNLAETLFSGGGNSGVSGFGSFLGAIFGGASAGRASGGPVGRGSLQQVNELGPELLTTGGKSYLMMGASGGVVTPNNKISAGSGGGGGFNQVLNISIDGSTDMAKNQQLISNAVARGNAELVDQLQRAGKI